MSNQCIIPNNDLKPLIKQLKADYGIDFKGLSDINELAALNNLLSIVTVNKTEEERQKILDLIISKVPQELIDKETVKQEKEEKKAKRSRNSIELEIQTNEGVFLRTFNQFDFSDFAEMFNSSFISLYNSHNLISLFSKEKKSAAVNSKEFKNEKLAELFAKFLYTVDETNKEKQNIHRINDIKQIFRSESFPFNKYDKDDTTKLFYVQQVFPLMMEFIKLYYDTYFKPEVWDPTLTKAFEENPVSNIDELVKVNPEFAILSKNKDVLTGTYRAFLDLYKKLNESTLSDSEKIELINDSNFNKVAEKLMDSFRYNDKAFGGVQDVTSEEIQQREEESNLENSNDTKVSREGFTSSGNEKSGFDSASSETRTVLSSLFDIDEEGILTDIFGIPKMLNAVTTFKQLSKILRGKIDYSNFHKALVDNKDTYPYIEQLLDLYLPIDPSDIEKFFNDPRYDKDKRQYLQRVKQAFLQDLSKNRLEAKEINLKLRKKWNKESQKFNNVISAQVNDAKQKTKIGLQRQVTTEFHQKYFKNKEKVFGNTLVSDSQTIRLETIIKAALKYKKIIALQNKEIKIKDVLDILSIFGIVPSDRAILARTTLKNLLRTSAVEKFFDKIPLEVSAITEVDKESILKKVFDNIQSKNIDSTINSLQTLILNKIKEYEGNKQSLDNTNKLIEELKTDKKINETLEDLTLKEKIKGAEESSVKSENEKIKKLTSDYLKLISDRFINQETISLSKERNRLNTLANELKANLTNNYETILKTIFSKDLSSKYSETEAEDIRKNLFNLTDPMNQLKSSLDSLYSGYFELEEKYIVEDDGIIDYSGKPRHLVQSHNNLMIKANDLNTRSNKLLIRFPELDPTLNPLISSSLVFKALYNIDADGNITPNNQSNIKININNILGLNLKSKNVNSGGLSINNQYEQDQIVSSMLLLLYNGYEESMNVDKEAAYNIQFKGLNSSQYSGKNTKVTMSTDFLPISSSLISGLMSASIREDLQPDATIKTKKYLNYATGQKAADTITPIAEIYKDYLVSYLLMYYKVEKGDLSYVKKEYENLGNNYKDLGLFEKDSSKVSKGYIIDAKLKEQLKEATLNLNLNGKSLKEMTDAINSVVKSSIFNSGGEGSGYLRFKLDLMNYFTTEVDSIFEAVKFTKNYEELNNLIKLFEGKDGQKKKPTLPYITDLSNATDNETDSLPSSLQYLTPDSASLFKGLLMNYVINYEILAQEKLLMFYGDPMFLKGSSYVKRASSPGSTGTYVLLDDWDIAYYNHPKNTSAFAFAKALNEKLIKEGNPGLNMDLHKLGYKYRYGHVEDNVIKSAVYDQLLEGFRVSIKLRFGDKFTEEEIENKAQKALAAYNKLNEADGYGVITLDWYKIFSELTNTWSPEQEYVYNLLAEGKEIPSTFLNVTFPVRKFQYSGTISKGDNDIPADGLHKFSLAPILPGSNNNLQIKNENLIKEGKAYEIFASANKKENLKNPNGSKDYFYYGNQKERAISPIKDNSKGEYVSDKKVLYAITNLLKDQVHIDTAVKNKVILARQLKRVGKTDLFENGIPFDFKGISGDSRPIKEQWDSLTKLQKRNASKVHKIYRGIVDNISEINSTEEDLILKKLGFEIIKKNGTKLLTMIPGVGKQTLINTLKNELIKRVAQQKADSANAYVRLLAIESKNDDVELEAFVNQKSLKSIMKSIIDKNTRFRKFNGSNLIQAPVTGMESASFGTENISVDQTGYLKTYSFGTDVNKDLIDKLEKEKQQAISEVKLKEKKKEVAQEYDEKINSLKGTTMAEVMMTFTPEWHYLLNLYHNGFEIGTLENLNKILREDKEWVFENKEKLSMLAVRIPIQDPNSIEAFIVKEFLPLSVGAKIVVPSEIVAKSGGDFDIDKLMVYYYNVDQESESIPFDNSLPGLENKIIKGYMDLLLLPEMFYKLVTANSISVLKDEELSDSEGSPTGEIVDQLTHYIGQSVLIYDNTDLRKPLFNIRQKTILQIAKKLLGHAATIRSNFEELKHAGLLLSEEYRSTLFQSLTKAESKIINDQELLKELNKIENVNPKIKFPYKMEDGSPAYNITNNKVNVSQSFNKDNVSITEIISAIMNGLVDVASKPWIVIFSMNEELTSYNFMMLLAGMPARFVFKVNNQKIIQDYIGNKLALKQSLYKRILNGDTSQKTSRLLNDTFRNIVEDFVEIQNGKRALSHDSIIALKEVFKSLGATEEDDSFIFKYLDTYIRTDKNEKIKRVNDIVFKVKIESFLLKVHNGLKEENFISDQELTNTLGKTYNQMGTQDIANQIKLLASTVFMKPVSEGLTSALEAIDYDKSQTEYIHEEYKKTSYLKVLKGKNYFDKASFAKLQKLHIAKPYDLTDLTKVSAAIVAPITESPTMNKFAISLAKILKRNRYITKEKEDTMINSFKSDFINYIVQNYGKIENTEENILEFFIKDSVFLDKKVKSYSNMEYTSPKILDNALPNQLFTLVNTFNKFKDLDVFSNYLIPVKGKKIENEVKEDEGEEELSTLDFIYKLGRVFRNLNPEEIDDYNKQLNIFKSVRISLEDVLYALETKGPEILEKYISDDNVVFDEVFEELKKIQTANKLSSLSKITKKMMTKIEDPNIRKAILEFTRNANKAKDRVSSLLPYLSLLQSTSLYSSYSISNLFIKDNYLITKNAIKNFKNNVNLKDPDQITEILKNFTVLFLLNNRNLLTSDKQVELLKTIVGKQDGEFNKFESNSLITNANYFNNYYGKTFSILDKNTNFATAERIMNSLNANGMEESFLHEFLDLQPSSLLEDPETSDVDFNYDDDETNYLMNSDLDVDEVIVDNNKYIINVQNKDIIVVDSNDEEVFGVRKNEVIIAYYKESNQLKMVTLGDKDYYVAGDRIISESFQNVNLSPSQRNNLKEKIFKNSEPCK